VVRAGTPVIGYFDDRFFLTHAARERFGALGDLRLATDPAALADCDVLCASHGTPIDPATMDRACRCRIIVNNGSAIVADLPAATARGIVVLHVPGQNARSVAEHTIGLLLDVWKGLTRSDRLVRSGVAWRLADPDLQRRELAGKSLGLIGFGHVGRSVAAMARDGLGMDVQVWSRRSEPVRDAGFRAMSDLDRLLETSDAVSLHLALNEATRGILDAARLARLRPGAIVVNTARAALVDCDALHEGLLAGRVGGAGFDVWPSDRPDHMFVLLESPNTVLTQHNAGFTAEASERSMTAVLDAIFAVLRGEHPTTAQVANPEVLVAGAGARA
jgi:D-3-phosphoglycerate dehydrogenase